MSHAFYNLQWQTALEDLAEQIEIENPPVELDDHGRPLPPRSISCDEAREHYACLYIRYISIFRRLEDCYDQVIHPQKRRDILLVLQSVMARLCQVKKECVRFGYDSRQSDYLNLDEYLIHLRLSVDALEIPVPRYFREKSENDEENKKRDVMEKCLEEHGMLGPGSSSSSSSLLSSSSTSSNQAEDGNGNNSSSVLIPKMTKEQAIRLIQKNERGRQGFQRAMLMRELRAEDLANYKRTHSSHERDPNQAATLIQKVFRGHLQRLKIARSANEEFVFIGMRPPQKKDLNGKIKYDPSVKEEQFRKARKIRQADNELKYTEALVDLQKTVMEAEGPDMRDHMWEQRYMWWIKHKEKTGKYPDNFDLYYREVEPGEEGEGGNASTTSSKRSKNKASSSSNKDESSNKEKSKKSKDASSSSKNKNQKRSSDDLDKSATRLITSRRGTSKKESEEKKAKLALTMKTLVGPTHLINHMYECVLKYKNVWSVLDESENCHQQHDDNIAKEKLRPLVREKIRKEVDLKLLAYLANIKLKVAQRAATSGNSKQKGKKTEKNKKKTEKEKEKQAKMGNLSARADGLSETSGSRSSTKKKKKSKKSSSSKNRKKVKKCCEGEKACAHMPLGDMISLLVKMGILQDTRKHTKTIKEFIGDPHVLGSDYERAGVTLDPSMAQLRACITEYGILPLGSSYVKEQAPLTNAILLYGPHATGKTHLAKAVAYETNACWFDLSARNVERKLGTKAEIAKLIHMVFKVAHELQPSVVYIDDIDRVFAISKSKNVPDLIKMKHYIALHKAMLTRNVRVLVVGNSRHPYGDRVDRRELVRFFGSSHCGKMLFCPCPNYPTRLHLWKHFITQTGMNFHNLERHSKFDLTTLSYISEGYSAGNILQAVQATLPARRVQKILENGRLLDSSEFIAALAKTPYTYKNDYASFVKFTDEVSGEKERRRLKELAAQREAEAKADDKKNKRRMPPKKKPTPL